MLGTLGTLGYTRQFRYPGKAYLGVGLKNENPGNRKDDYRDLIPPMPCICLLTQAGFFPEPPLALLTGTCSGGLGPPLPDKGSEAFSPNLYGPTHPSNPSSATSPQML